LTTEAALDRGKEGLNWDALEREKRDYSGCSRER